VNAGDSYKRGKRLYNTFNGERGVKIGLLGAAQNLEEGLPGKTRHNPQKGPMKIKSGIPPNMRADKRGIG